MQTVQLLGVLQHHEGVGQLRVCLLAAGGLQVPVHEGDVLQLDLLQLDSLVWREKRH